MSDRDRITDRKAGHTARASGLFSGSGPLDKPTCGHTEKEIKVIFIKTEYSFPVHVLDLLTSILDMMSIHVLDMMPCYFRKWCQYHYVTYTAKSYYVKGQNQDILLYTARLYKAVHDYVTMPLMYSSM